jgi:ABC-type branched-subunit amino acid transport system ATPase component
MVRTFQSARLFSQLSVLENLLLVDDSRELALSLHVSDRQREQIVRIKKVLESLTLESKLHRLGGDLSYGQKKLVELARVLLADKEVILLDEPFAGLFPKVIQSLIEVVKELKNSGKTIILVEHNPRIIRELCDRVVVLDAGEVIADGTPDEVFETKHVREAYLGE